MIEIKPGITESGYFSNLANGIAEWNSTFRAKTFDFLKDKNIKTVADVGANFGVFTDKCLAELPELTTIDSFEPDPTNFEILEHNLLYSTKTFLHSVGIFYGAEEGRVLGIGDNSPGGYMFAPVDVVHHGQWTGGLSLYDGKTFKMTTLEKVFDKPLDLLKIDVEGSEYNIVENSTILKECRYLIIEFHNHLGEYVQEFIGKHLPNFRPLEFTNDTYGSPYYWYAFLEKI
jgi:FkbM family methyltransferase